VFSKLNANQASKNLSVVTTALPFINYSPIYVGLPASDAVLGPLLDDLINELGIKKGPEVPAGVMARQIDKNHFLYLNVTGESKEIPMTGELKSILFDKNYSGNIIIPPYEPEFIEVK
jgi:beta-galactosidase